MASKPLCPRTLRYAARKMRVIERLAGQHSSEYATGMHVCAVLKANDFLEQARTLERKTKAVKR